MQVHLLFEVRRDLHPAASPAAAAAAAHAMHAPQCCSPDTRGVACLPPESCITLGMKQYTDSAWGAIDAALTRLVLPPDPAAAQALAICMRCSAGGSSAAGVCPPAWLPTPPADAAAAARAAPAPLESQMPVTLMSWPVWMAAKAGRSSGLGSTCTRRRDGVRTTSDLRMAGCVWMARVPCESCGHRRSAAAAVCWPTAGINIWNTSYNMPCAEALMWSGASGGGGGGGPVSTHRSGGCPSRSWAMSTLLPAVQSGGREGVRALGKGRDPSAPPQ